MKKYEKVYEVHKRKKKKEKKLKIYKYVLLPSAIFKLFLLIYFIISVEVVNNFYTNYPILLYVSLFICIFPIILYIYSVFRYDIFKSKNYNI